MKTDINKEPSFRGTGEDIPHEGAEIIERNAINAVVCNPKTGRYMLLKWKDLPWIAFVSGGIEKGQTAEEAVRTEVKQETGYINLKLISVLPRYNALFWHGGKKVN
ncbi:MAG: NUDIX hydrolase [Candidatus Nomurabacteria bacterium]|nr:MAG: NUDIX hydrolase [Candidatus Nomurabacteria bacterium]